MSEHIPFLATVGIAVLASIVGGAYIFYRNPKSIEALLEVDAYRNIAMYLHDLSYKKEFKKDDNKIRIRCNGEYECNGKTYVMPENFRKHSEYFLKSLLKLDNNQIRMHYINVEIPTNNDGIVELLVKDEKEMLHIINYFAGIDGSFHTTKKFNIFDKTPNNMFRKLEYEGLIENEVHELKITNNFGEIFTLKRDCEIKLESHLI